MSLAILCSSGCAGLKQRSSPSRPTAACCQGCENETTPTQELAAIAYESRQPIQIDPMLAPIDGRPASKAESEPALRQLSWQQCRSLAAASAPIAGAIESQIAWLRCNGACDSKLQQALLCRAGHERNEHVATAMEAWLNLADVSVQMPALASTSNLLSDTSVAIEKFRGAGVEIQTDTTELDRQQLSIEEQRLTLKSAERQLIQGLEALLNLTPNDAPLWTDSIDYQSPPAFSRDQAVAIALQQRGDLCALETLAKHCCHENSGDAAQQQIVAALTSAGSPLLGVGLPRPAAALWWQCKLKEQVKQQLACIAAKEAEQRRKLLCSLADTKRKQIRREVSNAVEALASDIELRQLKQRRRDSLAASIDAAELAKDEVPVDLPTDLKNRIELRRLDAEITHQAIVIAIDQVRLQKAVGGWANIDVEATPIAYADPSFTVIPEQMPAAPTFINADMLIEN